VECFDIILQFGIIQALFFLIRDYIVSPKMRRFAQSICVIVAILWGTSFIILLFDIIDITGFYTVSLIATLSFLAVMLGLLVVDYRKHKTKKWDRFFVAIISLFTAVEMMNYQVSQNYWIFIFIIGLFIYSIDCYIRLMLFIKNKIEESKTQERHLVEATSALQLAQIQPHFIFNVLNTIQYLCKKDQNVAAKALDDFTHFLRINTETLSTEAMIPFSKVLEQLGYYLSLEKLRFPSVRVRYGLAITDFSIPNLTLQPVVENAIRYGASVMEEGEVVISTREEGKKIVITVFDNGNSAFDPEDIGKNDGKTHVGIRNVRERIEKLCGGTMGIVHTAEGTTVTFAIEKERA
jgi:sensor histidine kinase YesM